MKKENKTKSINVKLLIEEVSINGHNYKDLYLKFKNGFKIRIDSKFELTPKQWGMFQATLEEEINNKERK